MNTIRLKHPIRTLGNRLLLPAGTLLSAETLDELISTQKVRSYQAFPFLQHGTVLQDLVDFMGQRPFHTIFSDSKSKASLLNLIDRVRLATPILNSLNYFKKYDFYTYRHILVVFALSTLLAQDLVENYQDLIMEAMAGPSHDFGKISVPLHILKKTDPLSRTERSILEHHTLAGFVLLAFYQKDRQSFAAKVARDHHERRGGSGYPLGITSVDPMVEIIAASDIYDALISPRPYRPISYDNRTALEELTDMAAQGKISMAVVQALVAHNRKAKPHHKECKVSAEKRGSPPQGNLYGVISDSDPPHD